MDLLKVLLIHRNDAERDVLRQAFEATGRVQIVGERNDIRSGMAVARQTRPDILLVDAGGPADDALHAVTQYRMEQPDVSVFVSTEFYDSDTLLRAMRAGAQEVLRRPLDRSALAAAVERVAAVHAHQSVGNVPNQVITVFSSKGGAGVSTIAANLALSLRRVTDQGVTLVDLDEQSGDAAFMLGLPARRSIADLASLPNVDGARVQDALTRHASGLAVLAQPEQMDQIVTLDGTFVGTLLEVLSATSEYVVVDAPHTLAGTSLEVFDRSSAILLVCGLTLPSVRAARRVLDVFERLNYLAIPDRVRVLVNRHGPTGAVSIAQVEETLGLEVFATIANDYAAVSDAIDTGAPLCAAEPTTRAGNDIERIARLLAKVEPVGAVAAPAPRGLLGIFGRKGKTP